MFAALGVGLGSGSGLVDALKVAVAAGALNATRRGLGTGTRDEIERLSRHVDVHPLPLTVSGTKQLMGSTMFHKVHRRIRWHRHRP